MKIPINARIAAHQSNYVILSPRCQCAKIAVNIGADQYSTDACVKDINFIDVI
jgi:hypothetical protein